MKSAIRELVENEVKNLYKNFDISEKTGFLPEKPLTCLPFDSGNNARNDYFRAIEKIAANLNNFIDQKKVATVISFLPTTNWPVDDLPRAVQYRLQLLTAMLMHAYFGTTIDYNTVGHLMSQNESHEVPFQIGIPLWKSSKITGIAPSMSYELYSPWNYRLLNQSNPICLNNIDLLNSFTGSIDEKWFVWIHQVVDYIFGAMVIKPLLKAHCLVQLSWDEFNSADVDNLLAEAGAGLSSMVNTLERMREHCGPDTYFTTIRRFYTIPKNLDFIGIQDDTARKVNILGETGGQDPWKQFVHFILGMDFDEFKFGDIFYFSELRENMSYKRRELLEYLKKTARLRKYIKFQMDQNNYKSVRRYNSLINCLLDWMKEHYSLAQEYVAQQREYFGTVKAPFVLLEQIHDQTELYLLKFKTTPY